MKFDLELNSKNIELLAALGVDVIDPNRKYWFVRTQGGSYFEDFISDNFIGIEWDEISDLELIKTGNKDSLKEKILDAYKDTKEFNGKKDIQKTASYIAGRIFTFINEVKEGDIVLIPNEMSRRIAFGVVLGESYIYEEDEFDKFLNDEEENDRLILKKRRDVKWLKNVKRSDLDPYLFKLIYSQGTISQIKEYQQIFIDRTLSSFYIKGQETYYTFKVNKKQNIPYFDMLKFLNSNSALIDFINKYGDSIVIDKNDLILKMNVQSKGPVQLKGAVKNALYFGLIIGALFGVNMNFKLGPFEMAMETEGVPKLLAAVSAIIDTRGNNEKEEELQAIKENLREDIEKLQIQLPESSRKDDEELENE